jgi:hypothetical protein
LTAHRSMGLRLLHLSRRESYPQGFLLENRGIEPAEEFLPKGEFRKAKGPRNNPLTHDSESTFD